MIASRQMCDDVMEVRIEDKDRKTWSRFLQKPQCKRIHFISIGAESDKQSE